MAGPRLLGLPSAAETEAYALWIGGLLSARDIADRVDVPLWRIYKWSHDKRWPDKHDVPMANQLRVAQQLWGNGVPAKMICLVCDIGRATLSLWRSKYGWEKRPAGFRPGWRDPTEVAKREAYDRVVTNILHEKTRRRVQERLAVRWRCECGRLCEAEHCPTCHAPHPLLAA